VSDSTGAQDAEGRATAGDASKGKQGYRITQDKGTAGNRSLKFVVV